MQICCVASIAARNSVANGIAFADIFGTFMAHEIGATRLKGRPVTQRLLLGAAFYFLWIGLSGHFSPFLLVTSVLSVVGVILLLTHLGLVSRHFQPFSLIVSLVVYWRWLLVEIVKANIDVIRCLLGLGKPPSPTMGWVHASQKTELCKALYANSITLTPGTITVLVEGDQFLIHALHREGLASLQDGEMDRRCLVLDEDFRGKGV